MSNPFVQVVQSAKEGDRDAFATLYSKTFKHTYFLTAKLLGNPEAAMGLIETTYCEAFGNLDQLQNPAAFPSWLTKTATNNCREYLAYNSPALFRNDETDEQDDSDLPDPPIPVSWVDKVGTRAVLISDIDRLDDAKRTVTYLRYYYELSVAQIAQYFSCSQRTIRRRLNDARLTLTEELNIEPGADVSAPEGGSAVLTMLLRKSVSDMVIDRDSFESTFSKIMFKLAPQEEYEEIEPQRETVVAAQQQAAPVRSNVTYNPKQTQPSNASRTNLILAVVLVLLIAAAIPATVFGVRYIKNRNIENSGGSDTPVSTVDTAFNWSTTNFSGVSSVEYLGSELAVFTDSTTNLKGLMNLKGDFVVAAEFSDIQYVCTAWGDAHVYATQESRYFEIDLATYAITTVTYIPQSVKLLPYWNDDRRALVTSGTTGETALGSDQLPSEIGYYAVGNSNSEVSVKYGYVNETGALMIKAEYELACDFSNSLGAVKNDGKWGYIDSDGKKVIPFDYEAAGVDAYGREIALPFNQGYAPVKSGGAMGIINKSNKLVVPFDYTSILPGSDGIFIACKGGVWGTIVVSGLESTVTQPHFTGTPSTLKIQYIVNTSETPLNMRDEAAQSADTVGQIPKGTIVTVERTTVSNEVTWGYVTYNSLSGWVNMQYLSTDITGASASTSAPATTE